MGINYLLPFLVASIGYLGAHHRPRRHDPVPDSSILNIRPTGTGPTPCLDSGATVGPDYVCSWTIQRGSAGGVVAIRRQTPSRFMGEATEQNIATQATPTA